MIERLTSYVARRLKRIRGKKSSVWGVIVLIGSILVGMIVFALVNWALLVAFDEAPDEPVYRPALNVWSMAVFTITRLVSLAAGVFAGYACMFLEDALAERREKWRGNY